MSVRPILLFIFLQSAIPSTVCRANISRKIATLDSCLSQKKHFDEQKNLRIERCRRNLNNAQSDEKRYAACTALFREYQSYKYDSAYVYANRSLQLARKMNKREYAVESESAIVFCLLSAGLYKEAFEIVNKINTNGLPDKYKIIYYSICIRLNYDISEYNNAEPYQQKYVKKGNEYSDSLLSLVKPNSSVWLYTLGQKQMKGFMYDKSIQTFTKLMAHHDIDTHTQAIATSCLGWMYWQKEQNEKAMEYLATSAICDLESSTKETTALKGLAEMLYTRGDIKRATSYVQYSLDDANFYDARQRKIEVGKILPIIEQNRFNIVNTQRNMLIGGIIIATILVIVLLLAFTTIYRQKKKLQDARNIISERNQQLQHTNEQLSEANTIKDEYIGLSFYTNAEFIEKIEKLYKMIDRKITTRQFDDLRNTLKESTLNKERDNLYEVFDATFLKLFPDFVKDYNGLFTENERKMPDNDHSLTPEMRIFALIRLGVNDSERIAKFLNYSVHTINTYKTRVKNRSTIDNDYFEQKIMHISSIEAKNH